MDQLTTEQTESNGRISAAELRIVRAAYSEPGPAQTIAIAVNRLGNGWVYLALPPIFFGLAGMKAFPPILIAAVSAGLAHSIYPWLKNWAARARPFDADPLLQHTVQALDKYSLPSGHVMTLTAVMIPLAIAFPYFWLVATPVWVVMAWAGISLAHHYPSDVLAGATIGATISVPLSLYFI